VRQLAIRSVRTVMRISIAVALVVGCGGVARPAQDVVDDQIDHVVSEPPAVGCSEQVVARDPARLATPSGFGDLRDSHVLQPPESYLCDGHAVAPSRYTTPNATLLAGFVVHQPRVAGEPIYVTFLIQNASARAVRFASTSYITGGTRRPARFHIAGVDGTGAPVADPDGSMEIDNIGLEPITLAPGATYVGELLLSDYLALDVPGVYTVVATRRTMGWDRTETNVEVSSTFQVQVLGPTPHATDDKDRAGSNH